MYQSDGHTDWHTHRRAPHDGIGRACIASRAKTNSLWIQNRKHSDLPENRDSNTSNTSSTGNSAKQSLIGIISIVFVMSRYFRLLHVAAIPTFPSATATVAMTTVLCCVEEPIFT